MDFSNLVAMSVERSLSGTLATEYLLQIAAADAAGVSQVARYRLTPGQLATLVRLCFEAQR